MRERFQGRDGKQRLVEALADQELVLHSSVLAQRLADVASVEQLEDGQELYVEGAPGTNSLYCLVSGSLQVFIKGRPANSITAGQAVGEFPILDPAARHSVTVRATSQSVVARVPEAQFRRLAHEHPEIWRNMAAMLMRRLRQTSELVLPAKAPCVFIGHGHSSLWTRVQTYLEQELKLPTLTYESEPRAGLTVVSTLETMLERATFAVLVLTAEDDTAEGGRRARQNVVHEAGLFQGALGFQRAILLVERGLEGFSNVAGLERLAFTGDGIDATFSGLTGALRREGQIT